MKGYNTYLLPLPGIFALCITQFRIRLSTYLQVSVAEGSLPAVALKVSYTRRQACRIPLLQGSLELLFLFCNDSVSLFISWTPRIVGIHRKCSSSKSNYEVMVSSVRNFTKVMFPTGCLCIRKAFCFLAGVFFCTYLNWYYCANATKCFVFGRSGQLAVTLGKVHLHSLTHPENVWRRQYTL